jgi:hypothetical protein
MELVSVLRVLARRRLLVLLGIVAAAVGGFVATGAVSVGPFGAPQRHSAVAHTQIQIDTPKSQIVDLEANTSAIGTQTAMLADRLPKSDLQAAIARTAGIAPARLAVLSTDAAYPAWVSPLATRAAEIAATTQRPYVLKVSATGDFPVISVEAAGPDRATVARLARAPTTVLQQLTANGAANPQRRLSVQALSAVQFDDDVVSGGRHALVGALVFVVLSVMWCFAIVIASGIARWWRNAPGDTPPPPLAV